MKKSLFFLAIFIILLFSTCKKDNTEESGPPKFTFTFNRIFDESPDKSTPPGFLFLYDSNGKIVKEQEIFDNRTIELTTTKEGTYSVGVFLRSLTDTKGAYNFTIYQNIPSGITQINKDPSPYPFFYKNLSINNIDVLDSIYIDFFRKNWAYIYNSKSKSAFFNNQDLSLNTPLKIYANKEKQPRYVFLNIKHKNSPPKDTLLFDYNKLPQNIKQFYELPFNSNWSIKTWAYLDNKFTRIGGNKAVYPPLYNDFIEFEIADIDTDHFYNELSNTEGHMYYFSTKTFAFPIFWPNINFEYQKQPNGTVFCQNTNNAKMVISNGKFRKDINTSEEEVEFKVISPTNSFVFMPQLPKKISDYYGLKNYVFKFNQSNIIGADAININFEEFLMWECGHFSPEWRYDVEMFSQTIY